MKITKDKNDILVEESLFNLTHTFDCGQCFRWNKTGENEYTGVALGRVLKISQEGGFFRFFDTSEEDFYNIWLKYFDFDTDYKKIHASLSFDETVKEAIKTGYGIRILHQDIFETILSFIISANNNIPRIKLIIERLCASFGSEIKSPYGSFYTFPTPGQLHGVTKEDLAPLKAGFRDKYLIDAVKKVNSGELDLKALKNADYSAAKQELLKVSGIGEKVANCILLFGLYKHEAFPIDVWVKRVMSHYYFGGAEPDCDLMEFAKEKFGDFAGFAQQYLFYHARGIKLK